MHLLYKIRSTQSLNHWIFSTLIYENLSSRVPDAKSNPCQSQKLVTLDIKRTYSDSLISEKRKTKAFIHPELICTFTQVFYDQCLNISEVQIDQSYHYFSFFFVVVFFHARVQRGDRGCNPRSIFQNIGLCKIYGTTPGRKQDPQNKDNKNKTYIHNCIIQESRNFELKIGPAK